MNIKTITIVFGAVLFVFGTVSCDSKVEEVRKDRAEEKAEALEDTADAVRDSAERRADQLEDTADRVRDQQ